MTFLWLGFVFGLVLRPFVPFTGLTLVACIVVLFVIAYAEGKKYRGRL